MKCAGQLSLAVAVLVVAGCGGKDPGPDDSAKATQLILVGGDGQAGPIGSALQTPLAVRALNSAGVGVAGVTVRFAVAAGGGTLTSADVTTGSTGQASTVWTLGPLIGASLQRVTATATGLSPVSFVASGQVGPPATIEVVTGNNQRAPLGTAVAFRAFLRSLYRQAWVVYAKPPFGSPAHVLHYLATAGHLDRGLKVRSMVLPDTFIDHDSPGKMYDRAGLNAPGIVETVLTAFGRESMAGVSRA
mgnify:CR=1 FL=1